MYRLLVRLLDADQTVLHEFSAAPDPIEQWNNNICLQVGLTGVEKGWWGPCWLPTAGQQITPKLSDLKSRAVLLLPLTSPESVVGERLMEVDSAGSRPSWPDSGLQMRPGAEGAGWRVMCGGGSW